MRFDWGWVWGEVGWKSCIYCLIPVFVFMQSFSVPWMSLPKDHDVGWGWGGGQGGLARKVSDPSDHTPTTTTCINDAVNSAAVHIFFFFFLIVCCWFFCFVCLNLCFVLASGRHTTIKIWRMLGSCSRPLPISPSFTQSWRPTMKGWNVCVSWTKSSQTLMRWHRADCVCV